MQIDSLFWHLQTMASKMHQFISSSWLKRLDISYEYTLAQSVIIKLLKEIGAISDFTDSDYA